MYPTTSTWKEAALDAVRRGYAWVAFGLIDMEAQEDAAMQADSASYYATPESILTDTKIADAYATFEAGGMKLDGSQRILPSNSAFTRAQGWISQQTADEYGEFETSPEIHFQFGKERTFVGLTLSFDEVMSWAPVQITVLSYRGGTLLNSQILSDLQPLTKAELLLVDIDRITIRFDKVPAYQRARFNPLIFGIGYLYSNNEIVSVKEKHTQSPISTELPQHDITIQLDNSDGRFDIGGGTELVRFLKEGQEIGVQYGLQTAAGIERVPSYKWYLSDWSTSGNLVTLKGADIYAKLCQTTYEKSVYTHAYQQTHDLIGQVLADVGITEYSAPVNYPGDADSTSNPLPICSHAEGLQLLANMAMCRLGQNYDGTIKFEQDSITISEYVNSSTRAHFANIDVLTDAPKTEYATFEFEGMKLDGSQKILPSSSDFENSGFVSRNITGAGGSTYTFTWVIPSYSPQATVYGIDLDFGPDYPTFFELQHRTGSSWSTRKQYYPTGQHFRAEYYAEKCDQFQITFQKTQKGYQRFRLRGLRTLYQPVFELTLEQSVGKPKGELLEKNARVNASWVGGAITTVENIWKGKIKTNSGVLRLEHKAGLDPQLNASMDPNADDVVFTQTHYAYVSYITATAPATKEIEIEIFAPPITTAGGAETMVLADEGKTVTVDNPMYSRRGNSELAVVWMGEYYGRREKYTYSTLGFPELECGDIITLPDGAQSRLIEHSIAFESGKFSGQEVLLKE